MGRSAPSLQTWMSRSEEQEAKQFVLCQSTSSVGAEEGGREGEGRVGERREGGREGGGRERGREGGRREGGREGGREREGWREGGRDSKPHSDTVCPVRGPTTFVESKLLFDLSTLNIPHHSSLKGTNIQTQT